MAQTRTSNKRMCLNLPITPSGEKQFGLDGGMEEWMGGGVDGLSRFKIGEFFLIYCLIHLYTGIFSVLVYKKWPQGLEPV